MIIREAVEADVSTIKSIEQETGLAPWAEQDYRAEIERKSSYFLAAESARSRSVIGFLVARLITIATSTTNPDLAYSEFELLNIGIRLRNQRVGIGKRLFDSFLHHVSPGWIKVFLEVRESNTKAISFYEGLGFETTGERTGFYGDPVEDALLMEADFEKRLR